MLYLIVCKCVTKVGAFTTQNCRAPNTPERTAPARRNSLIVNLAEQPASFHNLGAFVAGL
jgi:hypothetical protein